MGEQTLEATSDESAVLPIPPPPIPPAPATYLPGTYAPLSVTPSPWHVTPARMSGQAITALVCAVIGLAGGWFVLPLVASVAGIVLGHLALGAIGRAGGYLRGRGLAIAALVCSYGALVFWLLVWFGI